MNMAELVYAFIFCIKKSKLLPKLTDCMIHCFSDLYNISSFKYILLLFLCVCVCVCVCV